MGIAIEDLAVAYGGNRVIDGLALTIESGSFFTLLGPSGCGKTTLLRTIAGFVPVERGRLRFGGLEVTHLPPHRRDIGMVFQDYALFPDKTVFDNVAYGLRARGQLGTAIKAKVDAALERVGLGHLGSRLPAALSGGQRQRVALARALVIQPKVLLMDEPLSNLDAKLRMQVRETIVELQREARITTVFVTHDQRGGAGDVGSDRRDEQGKARAGRLCLPRSIATRDGICRRFRRRRPICSTVETGARQAGEIAPIDFDGMKIVARAPAALLAGQAILVARPEDIALAEPGAQDALPAIVAASAVSGWQDQL